MVSRKKALKTAKILRGKLKEARKLQDHWKQEYLKLKEIVDSSKAKGSHVDDHDPFTTSSLDPIARIAERFDEVLKNLTPKEVLTCLEVSKAWKSQIECEKSFNRSLKKIVVKINVENLRGITIEQFDEIMSSGRAYKHMESDFALKYGMGFSESIFRFPYCNFASSLESLKINCNSWRAESCLIEKLNFENLRQLVIKCEKDNNKCKEECWHEAVMKLIMTCSFPKVTHLKLPLLRYFLSPELQKKFPGSIDIAELLANFPNLKVFSINEVGMIGDWYRDIDKKAASLEAIYASNFNSISFTHPENLKIAYIENFRTFDQISPLEFLLENSTALETFYIENLKGDRGYFAFRRYQSTSLKTLTVGANFDRTVLHSFLLALPSLTTLNIRDDPYEELITLLATNMKNLKKFICKASSQESLAQYESIKETFNSSFEIVIDAEEKSCVEEFHEKFFE